MVSMRRVAIGSLGCAIVTACGAFGEATSSSPPVDAGSPLTPDAAGDAGGSTRFCATVDAGACLDFDDGKLPDPTSGWLATIKGNTMDPIAPGAHGSAGAIVLAGERPDGGAPVGATIARPLGSARPKSLALAAALLPEEMSGPSYDVFMIEASDATTNYYLQIELKEDRRLTFLEVISAKSDNATVSVLSFGAPPDPLPADRFTDLSLHVTIDGTTGSTATLKVGTWEKTAQAKLHTMTTFGSAYYGDRAITGGCRYRIRMDDFTFDEDL